MGTDGRMDQPTNEVSYRGACMRLKKKLEKKMALIRIDYKEGRLQPTPAGHPQPATPRANYFLLVEIKFSSRVLTSCTDPKIIEIGPLMVSTPRTRNAPLPHDCHSKTVSARRL
jgi:hypothetical protein